MNATSDKHIILIEDPKEFYATNKDQLDVIGGAAFHQPSEEFGNQVAERFNKAEIAQAMYDGDELIGFALYKLIAGHLWRSNPIC